MFGTAKKRDVPRLVAEGQTILNGRLAHGIKPGDQIWMVEDGANGWLVVSCRFG